MRRLPTDLILNVVPGHWQSPKSIDPQSVYLAHDIDVSCRVFASLNGDVLPVRPVSRGMDGGHRGEWGILALTAGAALVPTRLAASLDAPTVSPSTPPTPVP